MQKNIKSALFLTVDFPPMGGGMARHALDVTTALCSLGYGCVTIAPSPGNQNADVRRLSMVRAGHIFDNYVLSASAYFFVGMRYLFARKASLIVANTWSISGVGAYFIKKVTGVPYMVFAHGLDVYAPQTSPKARWLMEAVLNDAALVVANSAFTKRLVEEATNRARVVVINPMVDPDRLGPSAGPGGGDDRGRRKTILTVARLVESKGHDIVLKALPTILKKFPNTVYRIVGSGPEAVALRRLAVEIGVSDHVIFTGEVDEAALRAYYRGCDVFVMTSRQIRERGEVEGFGIAFLEAAVFSKPVIASRSGGIPDAVLDGVTGIIADPSDPGSVADAITSLFSDAGLAKRMGEAGRVRAEREFSPDEFARKLKDAVERAAQ